jgi:hypothetical protein
MRKIFPFLGFVFMLTSCCNYLPLVDTFIIFDFDRKDFKMQEDPYLINTEMLSIKTSATASIPNRCRSKKLKIFFTTLNFEIIKNNSADTLFIPLNQPGQIMVSDKNNTFEGKMNWGKDNSDIFLVIINNECFLKRKEAIENLIPFEFDYKPIGDVDWEDLKLKLNFQKIYKGESSITLNQVTGSLKK